MPGRLCRANWAFLRLHLATSRIRSNAPLAETPFSLSFTAASLRPELVRVVAEAYLQTSSWDAAKAQVISANSLQARSPSSALRMERELRQRLMHLTPEQLRLAAHGMTDERTAIAWLAAMKASGFIFAFAADVLRTKLALLDPVLRASDYEAFLIDQCAAHPEVGKLTPTTRTKIRSVLFSMVREAGIGAQSGRELRLQRPLIPPAVHAAILADSPRWLTGFLIPDQELSVN